MNKIGQLTLLSILGISCGEARQSDSLVTESAQSLSLSWDGWVDRSGVPATVIADPTAPFGGPVQQINRATSGGDYFSPWLEVVPGQSYCGRVAVKWVGGGVPFIAVQLSNSEYPIWIMGAAGYTDVFGPVVSFSAADTGWQQRQYTVVIPEGVTQVRVVDELFSSVRKDGADLAYVDAPIVELGACGSAGYSQSFESGVGGWADATGNAPGLASDSSSPSGPGVMSVTRAASGGDYYSPWTAVNGGQSYCVSMAVKWEGTGATPFVGLEPSTSASGLVWLVGAEGYTDAYGPVQAVNGSGWQQFQKTVTMPTGTTQARFGVELFSGAVAPGSHGAYFDDFAIASGACAAPGASK